MGLPFFISRIDKKTQDVEDGRDAIPDAEKKYWPGRGAVKIQVVSFMAPPTFNSTISNGTGTPT
jgi:hypothetical protein